MKLAKIDISNFKSIREASMEFNTPVSFILGRNNVGKSIISELFNVLKGIQITGTEIRGNFPQHLKNHNVSGSSQFILTLDLEEKEQSDYYNLNEFTKANLEKYGKHFNKKIKYHFIQEREWLLLEKVELLIGKKYQEVWNKKTKFHTVIHEPEIGGFGAYGGDNEIYQGHPFFLIIQNFIRSVFISVPYRQPNYAGSFSGSNAISQSGDNMMQFLFTLQMTQKERFKELSDKLAHHQNIKEIIIDPEQGLSQAKISIIDENGKKHSLAFAGSGITELLYFRILLADPKNKLLILEEPENHLHPHAQRDLMKDIKTAEKQVIVITHSPVLCGINKVEDFKSIIRTNLDNYEGTTYSYLAEMDARGLKVSELNKLISYLNSESKEILFSKSVIICEGITDKIYLNQYFKSISDGFDPDENDLSILWIEGISKIKEYRLIISKLKIKSFIIFDLDSLLNDDTYAALQAIANKQGSTYVYPRIKEKLNLILDKLKEYLSEEMSPDKLLKLTLKEIMQDKELPADEETAILIKSLKDSVLEVIKIFEQANIFILKYGELEDYYLKVKGENKTNRVFNALEELETTIREKPNWEAELKDIQKKCHENLKHIMSTIKSHLSE